MRLLFTLAIVISGAMAQAPPNGTKIRPSAATLPGATPSPNAPSGNYAVILRYSRLTDPLEQSFTVEVPADWHSEAGLVRHAALQINPYVRSLSPDKMTYIMFGDPGMPTFAPQGEIDRRLGRKEGLVYDAGLGGRTMILHYIPGAEFARKYGEVAFANLCPGLKFVSSKERPDLAHTFEAAVPTVIPSRTDGGEAVFTCTHGRQEMEARMEAVTRITRDNVYWAVIDLGGLIAPRRQADQAHTVLAHMVAGMTWSPAWVEKQNNLSQQAAQEINRRAQQNLRQEAAFIQKLNAVDENFEAMDEIITGNSRYHDAQTGQDYTLSNTAPYKWIDDSTGRIIGTATNSPPPFAYGYRPLPRSR